MKISMALDRRTYTGAPVDIVRKLRAAAIHLKTRDLDAYMRAVVGRLRTERRAEIELEGDSLEKRCESFIAWTVRSKLASPVFQREHLDAHAIRVLRRARRLTQERLAALLGVSFATVNRWEAGAHVPSSSRAIEQELFSYFSQVEPDSSEEPVDQTVVSAPPSAAQTGSAENRLLTFMASRLESMLRQPTIWGSLLSVEEQILQLLEIRRVLLVPSLTANDTPQLLRSYSRFISEVLDDATVEPLAVQLERRGRIVDFPALMGKFIEHEFTEFFIGTVSSERTGMNEGDKKSQLEAARNMEPVAAVGSDRRCSSSDEDPDAPWWLFTQNSTSRFRSACQHEQILLANEEEPTLCCRSCCKRWTFVPAGKLPRYCSEDDPKYPGMLDNRGWSKSTRVAMVDDQDPDAAIAQYIQLGRQTGSP
jgi:DNA-binding transcriptional regulator YiaG